MRVVTCLHCGLLLLALTISGCTSTRLDSLGRIATKMTSPAETPAEQTRRKVEQFLAEGSLAEAQAEILAARSKKVAEISLADLHTEVENRLLQQAEQADSANQFDKAGQLYSLALEIYPGNAQVQSTLVLSRVEINTRIEQCADELMKSGLMAYRAGELIDAVGIWKKIATFYPNHSPSEIAITTAEQQLKNLEKFTPDQPL